VPVAIRAEGAVDALYAPRRWLLDSLLVDAAEAAGAEFLFGCSLLELMHDSRDRVIGAVISSGESGPLPVEADIVIGADGVRSTVAQCVGAPAYAEARNATAVIYGYFPRIPDRGYRWHFAPGLMSGAIPTNGGETCVFVGVPATKRAEAFAGGAEQGFRRVLAAVSPDLAEEVAGNFAGVRLRPFGGMRGFLRQPFGRGWALVGDAGYFKDPVTAHGITDAFRDAELLSRAVVSGSRGTFADYQGLRDALSLPLMQVTDLIAGGQWSLDEVARLHMDLNQAMKTETEVMSRLVTGPEPEVREAA
jgi:flavin-dependent dehydrogenase